VPEKDRGEAAGMINTTEQLGGALGIAGLTAIEVGRAKELTLQKLADKGITPSGEQVEKFKDFLLHAEQSGIKQAHASKDIEIAVGDSIAAHVDAFQLMFYASAGIALIGAIACFILVRRGDRVAEGPIFGRRSRWAYVTTGHGAGVTKRPPPGTGATRDRP
jgi:hypothetical protein